MRLQRRGVLAGLALSAVAMMVPAMAQDQGPVKLGLLMAKQGVWAEVGEAAAIGAEIALQQAGGTVLGRPVELVWYDEPNAQEAQQNFIKLVEQDKVVAVVGAGNSATALAASAVANRVKVPLISHSAAAKEITGAQCGPYTFRTMVPTPATAKALVPHLLERGKDWYFLTGDYAWGHDIHETYLDHLTEAGGTELGFDPIPVGTSDYSSYILKVRQADPSVVVVGLGGSDLVNFLKQWTEFGMKDGPLVTTPIVGDSSIWPLGNESATGIYTKQWHYTDQGNNPAEVEFTTAFTERTGRPPVIEAWLGWTSMRMLLAGIENAGSTEGDAIVKGLEGLDLGDSTGPAYYRAFDHQYVHSLLIVEARPSPSDDPRDLLEVISREPADPSLLDSYYGTETEIGCQMAAL